MSSNSWGWICKILLCVYGKSLRDSQLFKGVQSGVYRGFTCAWQTPLETFLQALSICPDGHPHVGVLWGAGSVKILLFFLLTAVSQLLSLGFAVYALIFKGAQSFVLLFVSWALGRSFFGKISSAAPTSSVYQLLRFD